jgi:uncharacterized protein YndB with AHSA1/START domain
MARIVFEVEVQAGADRIVQALDTQAGIASWWTDDAEVPGGVGSTMTLGFPIAPERFQLGVDNVSPNQVRWRSTGDFPPHWVGTQIIWSLTPNPDGGTTLHFTHEGWAADTGPFATSAYTWAQLLGVLKTYAETGAATPLFTRARPPDL